MNKQGIFALVGGLVTAIAASACCILPLLLGAASAGSVGLSAALAPYRPYFISLTVLLLGGAFYLTYRPGKVGCETDCCDTKSVRARRVNKALLWLVTVFTVGALAYPEIAYRVRKATAYSSALAIVPSSKTAVFTVGNMSCAECTISIVKALKKTPGVYDARVDFASKRATVRYDASRVSEVSLRKAIERTGYSVSRIDKQTAGEKTVEKEKTLRPLTTLSDEGPLKEALRLRRPLMENPLRKSFARFLREPVNVRLRSEVSRKRMLGIIPALPVVEISKAETFYPVEAMFAPFSAKDRR
jgi:mercuric ion transport protein